MPTIISAANLAITALAALVLYKPFGIGGIVASTALATAGSVTAQCFVLRRTLGGLQLGRFFDSTIRVAIASAGLALVSFAVWDVLDHALGRSLGGQLVSLTSGLAAGGAVYLAVVRILRVPELDQIMRLLRRRS
jgi:putative peptidoglycan lipid II flippase